MIHHVVLFQPRADLPDQDRAHFLESLSRAAGAIPSIKRFSVGRRIQHGLRGYEQAMTTAYDYALIAEFDDVEGLKAYLVHPAHNAIGDHFTRSADRALAYDYEMVEASQAETLKQA